MIASVMRKALICTAVSSCLVGTAAFAADPAVSTTSGLPGYDVIKAPASIAKLQRVKQKLVKPPFVPEHSLTPPKAPRVVQVEMFIEEKEIEVEPGVFMWAFTFNGSVPGPMIIVHEGDYVELTLKNLAKNELVHNIDFHVSTGALGAGELTHVQPGQEVVVR